MCAFTTTSERLDASTFTVTRFNTRRNSFDLRVGAIIRLFRAQRAQRLGQLPTSSLLLVPLDVGMSRRPSASLCVPLRRKTNARARERADWTIDLSTVIPQSASSRRLASVPRAGERLAATASVVPAPSVMRSARSTLRRAVRAVRARGAFGARRARRLSTTDERARARNRRIDTVGTCVHDDGGVGLGVALDYDDRGAERGGGESDAPTRSTCRLRGGW